MNRTASPIPLDDIDEALKAIAAGRPVVVVDDADRENEGDLVFAADAATPELLAFMIRHTSGVVCVPMLGEDLDRLNLPLMTPRNEDRLHTAYTVTVDARTGVHTGISAADRARTIRLLADEASEPGDFVRPGHIFPLRYRPGGVLVRRGHTEAAVDLARLAGRRPAGVIAEIVLVSIEQLVAYRRRTETLIERVVETRIPNRYGAWRAVGYRSVVDDSEHVALVYGDLGTGERALVRLHSECLTGDAFGSYRCDCGDQLDAAMARIAQTGAGVIVYQRGHEGRGIGLLHKLRAYRLQDQGADTVDANLQLGLPADAREFGTGAQILLDLGVRSVRLLSNNPDKAAGLAAHGVVVDERIPLPAAITPDNLRYLRTKRDRMGHDLPGLAS